MWTPTFENTTLKGTHLKLPSSDPPHSVHKCTGWDGVWRHDQGETKRCRGFSPPTPINFPALVRGNGGVSKGKPKGVGGFHLPHQKFLVLVPCTSTSSGAGMQRDKGKQKGVGNFSAPASQMAAEPKVCGNSSAPGVISDRFWLIDRYKWQGTWKVTGYDWLTCTRYKYKVSVWGWNIWGVGNFSRGPK